MQWARVEVVRPSHDLIHAPRARFCNAVKREKKRLCRWRRWREKTGKDRDGETKTGIFLFQPLSVFIFYFLFSPGLLFGPSSNRPRPRRGLQRRKSCAQDLTVIYIKYRKMIRARQHRNVYKNRAHSRLSRCRRNGFQWRNKPGNATH